MAHIDLNILSLEQLKSLEKDLVKAITSYEERQKAEARAEVEAIARKFGYSLAALVALVGPEASVKARSVAVPKYRCPENTELTWSGRGRKPGWLVEGLAAGKSLDDFAIR